MPFILAGLVDPIATRVRLAGLIGSAEASSGTFYSSVVIRASRLHSETGTLGAVEPFEFRRSLAFVKGFGPMSVQQEVDGDSITRAVIVDGQVVVFRVSEGKGARLEYRLFSPEPISEETAKGMGGRIAFFLSLDDDVGRFYSIAKENDPKFYPLVESAWGLHHVKFLTFLEIASWALINQRIQRPIALRIRRSLMERFGASLEVDGKLYWAFPDGARLRAATAAQLLETTKNQRITRRLLSLASSLDELDEGFLRTALFEKAKARLEGVYGVGEWSSQFILFRGFGRMGKLQPLHVKRLGETIKAVYGSVKPLKEINDTYGSWTGYWQLYLWASTMPG
ncbi:MAG: DNA-3-methyladenine glycosylase family protein [Nitrososphaerales archaeon]